MQGTKEIGREDPRWPLLCAGVPAGYRVSKAWLALSPKQRRMFRAALEVEEIDCGAQPRDAVALAFHGCPRAAALGIIESGPNTSLAGANSSKFSFGRGFYTARDAAMSLHSAYSPVDAETGCKYLLKLAVVTKGVQPNAPTAAGNPFVTVPSDKTCFVDRAEQPRLFVHQKPSHLHVVGLLELAPLSS